MKSGISSWIRPVCPPFAPSALVPAALLSAPLLVLLSTGPLWAQEPRPGEGAGIDPLAAVEEGNRLFEAGELEAAADAYRRGFDPASPNSTLVFNLATTLHHLDHLPEAILWYRRGDAEDPWLEENLWLARRSLGSQRLPLGPALDGLVRHRSALTWGAATAAWLAFVVAAAGRRLPRAWAWITLAVALGLYTGGQLLDARGPKAVVLLEDCDTGAGHLPAGTEAWVRRADGQWRLVGTTGAVCPARALGFVEPDDRVG
ncbi:MAG: hypothetical protein MI919_19885 [Holophagales bacterium]|nr:hypothetical protein [Holophagales bacterium]